VDGEGGGMQFFFYLKDCKGVLLMYAFIYFILIAVVTEIYDPFCFPIELAVKSGVTQSTLSIKQIRVSILFHHLVMVICRLMQITY
jgi:hypothetical protein